ncbi:MAG: spore cortex biosynthesis protein YabQ [Clostridia bacterium]|nr:spore cortex biosynthesis protein YabQ [Clostridia bacterium]
MSIEQAHLFYVFTLTGILISLIFDVFRIIRKNFIVSDLHTIIQDILFFIITCFLIMYTLFKFNNGELRNYVVFGIAFGATIYFFLFSKSFIKINSLFIQFMKKAINLIIKVITFPFAFLYKYIRKIFLRPISFIFINIRKRLVLIIKKCSLKTKNKIINCKKSKKRAI